MSQLNKSAAAPRRALEGIQIIEWGSGRASAYAGRLLRGLGARVILVERDEEARIRAYASAPVATHPQEFKALTRFLHGGKLSVELDPSTGEGRQDLLSLIRSSDIVLLDHTVTWMEGLGLAPETIAESCPGTVVVATTLAGLTPSARHLRYSNLVAHAISGIANGTPGRVPDPDTCPPLKHGGYQADYTMGLAAASVALLGLQLRRRTGKGQLFDVSAHAIFASYMRMDFAYRTYAAADGFGVSGIDRRSKNGRASTLWGLVPCRDGYFAFQASEQYQWEALMRVMGDPAWAKEPRYQDPVERLTLWDEIEPHFLEWARDHDKAEIFHKAQENHVPVFPCFNVEELLDDPQQKARSFFVTLPVDGDHALVRVPGALLHLEKTPLVHLEPPPIAGKHTAEVMATLRKAATK